MKLLRTARRWGRMKLLALLGGVAEEDHEHACMILRLCLSDVSFANEKLSMDVAHLRRDCEELYGQPPPRVAIYPL